METLKNKVELLHKWVKDGLVTMVDSDRADDLYTLINQIEIAVNQPPHPKKEALSAEEPSYSNILTEKIEYYGETLAAYQFAAEEYARQYHDWRAASQFTAKEIEWPSDEEIQRLSELSTSTFYGFGMDDDFEDSRLFYRVGAKEMLDLLKSRITSNK